MKNGLSGCLAAALIGLVAPSAAAQDSKSGPLVKQLIAALEAAKLDTIAAKDPKGADVYVGALYIPGVQLLVISGSYSAPILLDARIGKKEYRDVYIDLNSASVPASRLIIEDLGADGLRLKREENQPFDTVDTAGKRVMFDNDWRKQKLSEEDYAKSFQTADDKYAGMLSALLTQIGK